MGRSRAEKIRVVKDPASGKRRVVREKLPPAVPKSQLGEAAGHVASNLYWKAPGATLWAPHRERRITAYADFIESMLEERLIQVKKNIWKVARERVPYGGPPYEYRWHGTSPEGLVCILYNGRFQPTDSHGLLGPGVYVADRPKASAFARPWGKDPKTANRGFLCRVRVSMGRIIDATGSDWRVHAEEADTIRGIPGSTRTWGGTLRYTEWCIRDPRRVVIDEVHLITNAVWG